MTDAAIDAGVKCVICLSTDKAAYSINAMGITKAIAVRVTMGPGSYKSISFLDPAQAPQDVPAGEETMKVLE